MHLLDEVGLNGKFSNGSLIDERDEPLLNAGEQVEHGVGQLDAHIAHLHLQIGDEVL